MGTLLCLWLLTMGIAGLCFDVASFLRDPVIRYFLGPSYGPSGWLLAHYLHFAAVWKWCMASIISACLGLIWLDRLSPSILKALSIGLAVLGVVLIAADIQFFFRYPEIVSRTFARLANPGPWDLPYYLTYVSTWKWGTACVIAGVIGVVAVDRMQRHKQ